jgi:diguanylate cyclase (GGDEF)-like protein
MTSTNAAVATLIEHLRRLTGERRRPRLEALLVEAIRDLLQAQRVAYYKLQQTADETMFWLAVETSKQGTRVLDDGINSPERLTSIQSRAEIADCILTDIPQQISLADGVRLIHPMTGTGSANGFIELDVAALPDAQQLQLVAALLTIFRNVMGLLDYSEVDTLTGLFNRKTFDEHLMNIVASLDLVDDSQLPPNRSPKRRHTNNEPISHWLAVLDIDHFKRINDNFGHLIGDEVLLMVANLMKTSFRFRDKLFRFGGEEFVVVLKPTGATQAAAIFDRFRARMAAYDFPQVGRVTISTGFAPIRPHDQPSVILDHADQALYWSKGNGRNRVSAYETLVAAGELAPPKTLNSDIELF